MLDTLKTFLKEIGDVKEMYLVSCFLQNGAWQVDFYSEAKHKITTYRKVDGALVAEEDDIFQVEEAPLEKLELENVRVDFEDAVKKVSAERDKLITILQVIKGKIVWNFTALTPTLHLYNLKVDAVNGDVISEHDENIMNFRMSQ